MATSTLEAEYVAACLATKEAIWLARILRDLHNQEPFEVTINVNTEGSIALINETSISTYITTLFVTPFSQKLLY